MREREGDIYLFYVFGVLVGWLLSVLILVFLLFHLGLSSFKPTK